MGEVILWRGSFLRLGQRVFQLLCASLFRIIGFPLLFFRQCAHGLLVLVENLLARANELLPLIESLNLGLLRQRVFSDS